MGTTRSDFAALRLECRCAADATIAAAMRADQLLDQGDLDGAAVWRRIKAAIKETQKQAPGDDDTVH